MTSSANQVLGRLRVLIVDDHDINREYLRVALSGLVKDIVTARDGRAAVALCQGQCFDVVLMDLHMPHLDGLAASQRIRQSDGLSQNARILILTADARPEAQAGFLENGADGHLNKPITVSRLISAILDQVAPDADTHALTPQSAEETALIVPAQALDHANGDPVLAERMARMFASELSQRLPELEAMIAHGDYQQVAEVLHQWRGACGFAGAARLYQACAALDQSLLEPKDASAGQAYLEFVRTAQATQQALNAQQMSWT